MANICIKSFQVLNNENVLSEFPGRNLDPVHTKYEEGGGRDGTRLFMAYMGGSLDQQVYLYHPIDSAKGFVGFRLYPSKLTSSNRLAYMSLVFGIDVTEITYDFPVTLKFDVSNLYLPDGTIIPHEPDKSYYVELGYDGSYGEIRIDGSTVYRIAIADKHVGFFRCCAEAPNTFWIAFQDFYINNGEGNIHNSFWGDIKVDAFDASGVFENQGFESNNDSPLHEDILSPANKDRFISAKTKNNQILFEADDIGVDRNPLCLAVTAGFQKKEVGQYALIPVIYDGGTQREGGIVAQDANQYGLVSASFQQASSETPWSIGAINDLKFGVKIKGYSDV